MEYSDVLIVGSGHGGAQAALALRQRGFAGSLTLASRDPDPPYERPPLSKEYLAGEKAFERILIRPDGFWQERGIGLLSGCEIVAIEPEAKLVHAADGRRLGYGQLVWAAGADPIALDCPGEDLAGVHTIRSRADADRLRTSLSGIGKVAVVGGGYIGLEAAAVLRKLGKPVVVVEAMDRVLSRVAGEPLSRFYEAEHRAQGVDVRLNARVEAIEGEGGRVKGLAFADGRTQSCDAVVVGIGVRPCVAPLLRAGATGSAAAGVEVDAHCRTSLADIFAIGDCAAHANPYAGGRRIRLESVQNASDQAATVAAAILGEDRPYACVPWFWSNQYDLKLQTVGLSLGSDAMIVRGDPVSRSWSLVYLRDGKVAALDCVNAVRDYVQGRKLVELGVAADPAALADPGVPLKALAEP